MKKIFLFSFFFFFIIGCGYKPSSVYQNKILGNKIKPIVEVDVKNPRETIFLKDALNDAIYTILNKNIDFENYDTIIKVNPNSSSLSILDYDENGYPYLYRSSVVLKVEIVDKNKKKYNYTVSGSYDFTISTNSVITDQTQLDAYKKASINALNKLFAKITKEGIEK
ncbi:hypothetical protein FE773_02305 [Caminibacter mediatlanticus TB-2]|uniref:Penicillin-binding protein n=1 Tax=Caminibacter mediatlanticus TB-2 TaxID=391592 RepID=A0AAI9F266_9BACT|nr:LPS assembly lipoprotein LptE [Caminibacter mediatlanticus]EDM23479.1 hypothetical protein CMTB2_08087 [Caminibacter mediatlanticus TB-2]QCT94050.1 hypothetical protein FE773_02305 [Caminibacter mediatlanticus TB-2]